MSSESSRVVVVRPGEVPPLEVVASILVCHPMEAHGSAPAATALMRRHVIDEITAAWTTPGTLMVIAASTGNEVDGEASEEADREHEMFWLYRVDVVLVWPVANLRELMSLLERLGHGRTAGWSVLGVPTTTTRHGVTFSSADAEPIVAKHHPRGRVGSTIGTCARIALELIGAGARRTGGQRHVPLPVWTFEPFQDWLQLQQQARNTLTAGLVEWVHPGGPQHDGRFLVGFRPSFYVASEGRVKEGEAVIIRPSIHMIVAFLRDKHDVFASEVVIVAEFRPASMNTDGFVYEIPGGSGVDARSSVEHAVRELFEEAGLVVDLDQVHYLHAAQPLGSLTAFSCNICWVELTADHMVQFRDNREPHGVAEDSERTYSQPGWTMRKILTSSQFDLTTRGAVAAVAFTVAAESPGNC